MDVSIVHKRDISAPPAEVGALLDGLGRHDDRLWPADRWPADMRIGFDRPLGIGAEGGHGPTHYSVEAYEPGRRVTFRFLAESGLAGTHRFDIESDESIGSRLTHTLEAQIAGSQRLLWPVVRRFHDAYIEDIFDRAERAATGEVTRPARQPRWMRVLNLAQMALDRWRPATQLVSVSGVAVPASLLGVAAIHAAWASGWRWPGGTDAALAERVFGAGAELPAAALTWAVAGALGVAAAVVRLTATRRAMPMVTWLVAGVLGVRGLAFVPVDLAGGLNETFSRLDLALYSPLCLALGFGAAVVAHSGRPETAAGGPRRRPVGSATSTALLSPGPTSSG